MTDPTYVKEQIDASPTWKLAWVLSEIMNDGAPIGWGKYIPIAECLLAAFDVAERGEIRRLREQLAELLGENTRLRAALAFSDQACAYCQLPADEFAKCTSGFPGCARADDMTGCPEFGSAMSEHLLHEDNDRLREQLRVAREALEEIWASVPATFDDKDPMVQRHAAALNGISAALKQLGEPHE